MASIPIGSSTLILNGYTINNFVEGDYIDLNPLNPLSERLNGANNSFTVTHRIDSNVYDCVFRVLRHSGDDVILTGFINQNPIVVFNGSLKEQYLDTAGGGGGIENWTLEGGTFTTLPVHKKNNQTGNHVVEYTIQFRNAKRVL
jgi:hypothetical protein